METALEHALTSLYKVEMISYMNAHPEAFEEAIKIAISDKQPYAWRAASLVHGCMKVNDSRLQGYIRQMINAIPTKTDGHQRELIKILRQMELNEDDEGFLFNVCVNIWEKTSKQPSVRHTAFLLINKTAGKYPDLANEIALLTQDQYLDSLSPGIKQSVRRIIKKRTL